MFGCMRVCVCAHARTYACACVCITDDIYYQIVDGGWWEGILNDQVGWFPGNHVEEISPGTILTLSNVNEFLCSREQFPGIKGAC